MKNEKLFRETPFGGYKREDVLSYIEALDNTHKAAIEELNERILELNDQLSEDARQRASMEKELEIKTGIAAEGEALKTELEEKNARIEELLKRCEELSLQTEAVANTCEALTKELEKTKSGFSCDKLQGGICVAVTEQADKLLSDAEKQAKQKISDAEEQASGIILKARMEAQAMITEAEGQTDALARQVSDEAHEIISMTVREAKEIINTAKTQSDGILADSAKSIGKIKGNLSSMQMVVRNIENELRSAKQSLADGITKKED